MKQLTCLLSVALVSCAINAPRMNNVRLGMTRSEAVHVLGQPASTSAQGNTEYLNYKMFESRNERLMGRFPRPYFVRLVDGRVESFGRVGDFDSTKPPPIRVESDVRVTTHTDP